MSHLPHCHQPISVVLLSLPLPCHSKLISHMTSMSQVIGSKQPGHRTEHPRTADFTFGPFQYSNTASKDPIPTDSLVHRLIRQTAVSVRRKISHYVPASPYQPGVYPCSRPVTCWKPLPASMLSREARRRLNVWNPHFGVDKASLPPIYKFLSFNPRQTSHQWWCMAI